jgi:uncharacterized RDD family membrane protein YckC
VRYGKFGHRSVARLIDYLIVTVMTSVFQLLWSEHLTRLPAGFATALLLSGMLFQIGFTSLFLSRWGATPGKMLFKLKVVTPSGTALGQGQAFARPFAELLSQYTLFIGYLMAALDKTRQQRTLHDRICNTRVVYR